MNATQLDLFPKTELETLHDEVATVRAEMANLRKGLFARHTELSALYIELHKQQEFFETLLMDYIQENAEKKKAQLEAIKNSRRIEVSFSG